MAQRCILADTLFVRKCPVRLLHACLRTVSHLRLQCSRACCLLFLLATRRATSFPFSPAPSRHVASTEAQSRLRVARGGAYAGTRRTASQRSGGSTDSGGHERFLSILLCSAGACSSRNFNASNFQNNSYPLPSCVLASHSRLASASVRARRSQGCRFRSGSRAPLQAVVPRGCGTLQSTRGATCSGGSRCTCCCHRHRHPSPRGSHACDAHLPVALQRRHPGVLRGCSDGSDRAARSVS